MAIYPTIQILDKSRSIPNTVSDDATQWADLSQYFDAYRIQYGQESDSGFEELYRVGEHILLRTIDSEELQALESDAVSLGEHLTFAFKLTGDNTLSHKSGLQVEMGPGSLLVGFSKQQQDFKDHAHANQRYAIVTLAIKPSALTEPPLNLDVSSLPESICNIIDGKLDDDLFIQHYQFDAAIQQCLIGLISCPFSGTLRSTYMQSKSHELLCLTLDLIQKLESQSYQKTIDPRVYEQLNKVSEILFERYTQPPSISELAKQVGMSEASLKKGFKRLFGFTIGERIQQLRMTQAQVLLRQNKGSITHIANSLGYEHASNFITAFKRQFGFTPKAFQKQNQEIEK